MWIFLGSDCMFFGSLIGTYLSYKGKSLGGPTPHDVFNIPLTSESAAVLLLSSLTMVLALAALEKQRPQVDGALAARHRAARRALRGQPGLRVLHLRRPRRAHAVAPTCSAPRFFVLTGFHGAHVTGGVIWLLGLWCCSSSGAGWTVATTPRSRSPGLYWHFVDIVWIAIFTIIYLIP